MQPEQNLCERMSKGNVLRQNLNQIIRYVLQQLFRHFTLKIYFMKTNLVQEKARQRNITPNFLRFKRKSTGPSTGRKDSEEKGIQTHQNSQRSSSRASRCSFQVYQKRVLHLSKLRSNLQQQKPKQQGPLYIKRTNYATGDLGKTRTQMHSNEKNVERENSNNQNFNIHKLAQTRKKTTSSGKNLLRVTNRTPSRGAQDSLQKQQENAKKINAEFINVMMKNHIKPNYINKVQQKKVQSQQQKKKLPANCKASILNLTIPIQGQEEMKKYEIFGELGKGAYGVVRMGVDKRSGQKIAIKIYQKKKIDQPNKVKNLQRQINLLAQLQHPTIAKLIQAIQTPTQIYLILQYGGANSLYNYLLSKPLHRMQEDQAKKFVLVIAEALQYLHSRDIVHRDIKAENILINRHKELKLIDFGFSLRCPHGQTIDTFCGTPTYMAPQIVSKLDHCPVYTDMWSLGILFYVMLQGNYPFRAKNQNQLFDKIKKGQFEYIHHDISQKCKKFIEALLKVNPMHRLTIFDVLSKENRAWLGCVSADEQKTESF